MDALNVSSLIQSAHRHLEEEDTAFILFDFDGITRSLSELKSIFPETTCHAVAVKANPLIGVLTLLQENGFGAAPLWIK